MTMPTFAAVNDSVLAAGTSSAGRTRGTIAPRVEEATANPAACTATSPSSRGRPATPSRVAASSPPVHAHSSSDPAWLAQSAVILYCGPRVLEVYSATLRSSKASVRSPAHIVRIASVVRTNTA